ncbi:MAG TPA: nickel pincer cofactor biosynthesis protein LarC [Acidimicrobiales bacterium]|nr:nickel pincer cofactor biosynthesis protein LarC [Acidimicrobiales bacterium]
MTAAPSGSSTVAWFHCFAGIAGDMALGSLVDAGADVDEIRALLDRLALPGWHLEFEDGIRGGIACTRAIVGGDDVVVRTHGVIAALIEDAALPDRVTARAQAVFSKLAAVESALHRRPIDQVHFHEVGGHDAIIDIVGTAAALEVLGVDDVSASAVATGTGMVRSAHGRLPNPAPATVRLLEGIPSYGREVAIELTTPTGAALLAALSTSFGPLPDMTVASSGFGGGTGEMDDLPNCTQVVIGRRVEHPGVGPGQGAVLLETNLDDVTGEQLGLAVAAALEAGGLDAWVSPVIMKKGRPGHVLHVLSDATRTAVLRAEIQRVTGTMGIRATAVERWPVARVLDQVTVDGMTIRMKVSDGRAKPEFDDVALVAAKTGTPPHEVASRAEEAWRAAARRNPGPEDASA